MRRLIQLISVLCIVILHLVCMEYADSQQDYSQWGLPDGAMARLGKGGLGSSEHNVAFSPDGAVSSTLPTCGKAIPWAYGVVVG